MKNKGTIAIYSNRYKKPKRKEVLTMTETKSKTKKIIYWVASIAIAIATCVLGLLETSCCPNLVDNVAKGYRDFYETIFYTVQDGDTTYYATKATLEELKKNEANLQ